MQYCLHNVTVHFLDANWLALQWESQRTRVRSGRSLTRKTLKACLPGNGTRSFQYQLNSLGNTQCWQRTFSFVSHWTRYTSVLSGSITLHPKSLRRHRHLRGHFSQKERGLHILQRTAIEKSSQSCPGREKKGWTLKRLDTRLATRVCKSRRMWITWDNTERYYRLLLGISEYCAQSWQPSSREFFQNRAWRYPLFTGQILWEQAWQKTSTMQTSVGSNQTFCMSALSFPISSLI